MVQILKWFAARMKKAMKWLVIGAVLSLIILAVSFLLIGAALVI